MYVNVGRKMDKLLSLYQEEVPEAEYNYTQEHILKAYTEGKYSHSDFYEGIPRLEPHLVDRDEYVLRIGPGKQPHSRPTMAPEDDVMDLFYRRTR